MSRTVIKVENLWKKYRLGVISTGRLAHDLNRWWHKIRGRPDPYLPVSHGTGYFQTDAKNAGGNGDDLSSDEIWALRDVSFEFKQGEVLGIIGRNGAGKSTLLKILSRVTAPTRGLVRVKGRIASLLEVGTGFHPDLTGRENIFLNGAILGMSKAEIRSKLDEIVAFAELEKFIDTPVKRYSSGMYVRLAFAVAAHLEPEILIVDEVLAVGDAQFQKKCLGKMSEVSREHGRTVLFVSHNMAAVRSLCARTVVLEQGRIIHDGPSAEMVQIYLERDAGAQAVVEWSGLNAPRADGLIMRRVYILNDEGKLSATLNHDRPFQVCIEYELSRPMPDLQIGFFIQTLDGVGVCGSNDVGVATVETRMARRYVSRCHFPAYVLNEGHYQVQVGADSPHGSLELLTPFCLTFFVQDLERHGHGKHRLPGIIRPRLQWNIEECAGDFFQSPK